MGALPQMLMNLQRGPGSLGPVQGGPGSYISTPNQAQSTPPSTAAGIATGVANFLTAYVQGRKEQKDRNTQEAFQAIQMKALGLPVDDAKLAKKLKMSHLGEMLDFEGNNSATQPGQPQQMPVGAQPAEGPPVTMPQQGGGASLQAAPDQAMQQMLMSQAQDAPTVASMSPPPARPTLANRLGIGPGPVNPASSGMAWLGQLTEMGKENSRQAQVGQQQAATEQNIRTGMLDLLGRAIKGDPHALELATRLPSPYGLKDMPFDGLLQLGRMNGQPDSQTAKQVLFHALGGEQALQHTRELAVKLAPNFGGDVAKSQQYVAEVFNTGRSSLKPSRTIEEQLKVQESADRLSSKYPTAPLNMIMAYAELGANGNADGAHAILDYMSNKFKREGTISGEQFDVTSKWHRDEMNQAAWMHRETMQLNVQKAFLDAAGDEGKVGAEMMKSKEDATRKAGAQMLAAALNRRKEVTATFPGANGKPKTIPFAAGKITTTEIEHWFKPNDQTFNFENDTGNSKDDVNAWSGKPAEKEGTIGKMMKKAREMVEKQMLQYQTGNDDN